jgi:hypothetical protein
MSDLYVYRSRDPEAVAAWIAACDAVEDYVAQTAAILKDAGLGGYQVYRDTSLSPGRFAGLAIPHGGKPPPGWRMGARFAVPHRGTKAGREVYAALEAVKHPGDPGSRIPGMPGMIVRVSRIHRPGVRVLENGAALYVTWSTEPRDTADSFVHSKSEVDPGRWQRIPLSEYYAEVERTDAAKAEAGATS